MDIGYFNYLFIYLYFN